MKFPEAVVETSMIRSWVDQVRKRELLQSSKTLKSRTVDDLLFVRLAADEPVDRISNSKAHQHRTVLGEQRAKNKCFPRYRPQLRAGGHHCPHVCFFNEVGPSATDKRRLLKAITIPADTPVVAHR